VAKIYVQAFRQKIQQRQHIISAELENRRYPNCTSLKLYRPK